MSEVALRPVHHTDVSALARCEAEVYGPEAWSEGSWWGELARRPRRDYVVAEAGGELVGYAGLDLGVDVADVMTVTLTPSARGRGLGHVLMRWLVHRAQSAGAEYVMLEVRYDNAPALALYERWGFTPIARRPGYYAGVDALILRRRLAPADASPDEAGASEQEPGAPRRQADRPRLAGKARSERPSVGRTRNLEETT